MRKTSSRFEYRQFKQPQQEQQEIQYLASVGTDHLVRWALDGVALAGAVDGIHDVALGASHVRALAFAGLLVEAGVRLDALAHALAFAILLLLVELGASVGAVARAVGVVAQLRRRAVVRAEAAAVVGVLSLRSRAPVQGCEGMFNIYSFFFFFAGGRKEGN